MWIESSSFTEPHKITKINDAIYLVKDIEFVETAPQDDLKDGAECMEGYFKFKEYKLDAGTFEDIRAVYEILKSSGGTLLGSSQSLVYEPDLSDE